ncbi:hypothetical protein FGW37_32115 [Streptomyces rectiverticillatus]|nr:hypothetical protein FGW37_32115 [Streptomyces rectiverticillatus]
MRGVSRCVPSRGSPASRGAAVSHLQHAPATPGRPLRRIGRPRTWRGDRQGVHIRRIRSPPGTRGLRAWRDRLAPAQAGLPAGPRRRAPGLRHQELATLAGLSASRRPHPPSRSPTSRRDCSGITDRLPATRRRAWTENATSCDGTSPDAPHE